MSDLIIPKFYDSSSAIAKAFPTFTERFQYKKLLEVAKQLGAKSPERSRAEIETQVALAISINAAIKEGEVTAVRNGKSTVFQVGKHEIPAAEVDRWRKVKAIPKVDREVYYKEFSNPSRNGLLKWWSEKTVEAEIVETMGDDPLLVDNLDILSGQKFGCVYADPPWSYSNQGTRAATGNHYSTMPIDDLCAMPIKSLVADDAHLHLWTTNSFLREAFDVMQAWGFEYKSCAVWCKPQLGIGNYVRVSHEFLLIGVRGDCKSFKQKNVRSWFELPRSKHSAKPGYWRTVIEDNSPGPYLELFGRQQVKGWTIFGNQISRQRRLA